jgi:hypothetical protein
VGGGGHGGSIADPDDVEIDIAEVELGPVLVLDRERFEGAEPASVSVSEPLSSSSQDSATGADFGFTACFWGVVVESLRWVSVSATSVERVHVG